MVGGVAQVQVYGSQKYAVRVQLDPSALAHRKIGIDEVATAISDAERQPADGRALGAERPRYTVQATGQLKNAAQFRDADRRVSQRRAGAPRRARPGARRRAEQQDRELVQRRRARSCSRSSASRARTRSPSPNAREGGARRSCSARFRRRCDVDTLYDRSVDDRGSRCTT